MSDEHFMRAAIVEAEKTLAAGGLPVGAVLVENGEILAMDHKDLNDFHLGHAETRVIEKVFRNVRIDRDRRFTLYTTIEPCAMCFGTILHCSVINRVVYALEDPWGGATNLESSKFRERHHKHWPEIKGGVLREEVREMAKKFLEITEDPYWHKLAQR